MKVLEVLQSKGADVHTVGADRPVLEVLFLLNRYRIGALLVTDTKGGIAGLISERDVLRHIHAHQGVLGEATAGDLMTPRERLVVAVESDDIDYVMNIMTANRIRHVPVVGAGALKGMLSIGDLVKALLTDREHENKMLHDYITGRYPA